MGFGASEKSLAKFAANQREYSGKERDVLRAAAQERIGEGVYALNEKTLRQEQVRATQLRHQNSSNQTNQHAGEYSAINGLIAPARVKRRDQRNKHLMEHDYSREMLYLKSPAFYGGACRVIKVSDLQSRVSQFRAVLGSDAMLVHDLLSEADPLVLTLLQRLQVWFSVHSRGHLERARVAGISSETLAVNMSVWSPEAVLAAERCRPAVVSIGSNEIPDAFRGIAGRPIRDWRPTLHVHVALTRGSVGVAPSAVSDLIRAAIDQGFKTFGLSVRLDLSPKGLAEMEGIAEAIEGAVYSVSKAAGHCHQIQFLGGLINSSTLASDYGMSCEDHLHLLRDLKESVSRRLRPEVNPVMMFEAGQYLVGHVPVISQVISVKSPTLDGAREVFISSHVYGDLSAHMYQNAPVSICILQKFPQKSLANVQVDAVVHGATCDSVDSIRGSEGSLLKVKIPADLETGDFIALQGPYLGAEGVDFNLLPPARVVIDRGLAQSPEFISSIAAEFHRPVEEATRWFVNSQQAGRVSSVVAATRDLLSSGTQWAGNTSCTDLDHLRPAGVESRYSRLRDASLGYIVTNPRAPSCFVVLDLEVYAAALDDLHKYLRFTDSSSVDGAVLSTLRSDGKANQDLPAGVDEIYIPLKALSDPIAAVAAKEMGFGIDAASLGELRMARDAGLPSSRLILSHPNKDQETLEDVCNDPNPPWAVAIDSPQELRRLANARLSTGTTIMIRVKTTGVGVKEDLNQKFGMPTDSARAISEIMRLLADTHEAGYKKVGWAFHVGTQCFEPGAYGSACELLLDLTERAMSVPRAPIVDLFNIGGGFCDDRVARSQGLNGRTVLAGVSLVVSEFRKKVEPVIGRRARVIAEPGRISCARAGAVVSRVLAVSMDGCGIPVITVATSWRGALSGNVHDHAFYGCRLLDERDRWWMQRSRIVGCSGHDRDVFHSGDHDGLHALPRGIQAGDYLMFPEAGAAYGVNAAAPGDGDTCVAFFREPSSGRYEYIKSPLADRYALMNSWILGARQD